ncbi:RNA-binding protein 34-like [Phlebotomus argentipes]|uniref:RNA-binding protein 34-like n=1 Tax=Phlebotomus argentipes TaxID=94469 RepID=UPI0028934957|nr:RNA-binding protein 34-like [Phlebotomus argentipes]
MAKTSGKEAKEQKNVVKKAKKVKKSESDEVERVVESVEQDIDEKILEENDGILSDESDEDSTPRKKDTPAYDPSEASRTIFVGNLPTNTKKSQVKAFFASFGTVKTIRLRTFHGQKIQNCRQIKNHPCITAYLVFDKDEAAIGAQEASGKVFRKAHIRVMMADGKKKYFDGKRTIFVGNLTYAVTDDDLYEIFQSCGEIKYVRTLRSPLGCKGTAYVCFKNPESVGLALELNQTMMNDRPIRVERYKSKPKAVKGAPEKQKGQKAKPGGKKLPQKKSGGKAKTEFQAKKNVKRLEKGPKGVQKQKPEGKTTKGAEVKAKAKKNKKHRSSVNMGLAKRLNPKLKKPKKEKK